MKKASIIGLGNISDGDFGVGCYILEALSMESFKDSVQLFYLGEDPRCAGGLIYGSDLMIIVGALSLGGPPGRLHAWSYRVFRQHLAWLAVEYRVIGFLMEALARAELAEGFPEEILFMWIEPRVTEGFGMSRQVRKSVWKAVQAMKYKLFEKGFCSEGALKVMSGPSLDLLGTAA